MKKLIYILGLLVISNVLNAQDLQIETESVTIENLISFVVDEVGAKPVNSENQNFNLTFLIQTSNLGLSSEDKVILKQAFKLVSDRLSEDDHISILTYSGFSGTALPKSSPKALKSILYSLEHIKSSVKEFHSNGIEHAYTYAENHYQKDAINTVIMIRNPNILKRTEVSLASQDGTKPKNNAALITAIALLPELISVIKD